DGHRREGTVSIRRGSWKRSTKRRPIEISRQRTRISHTQTPQQVRDKIATELTKADWWRFVRNEDSVQLGFFLLRARALGARADVSRQSRVPRRKLFGRRPTVHESGRQLRKGNRKTWRSLQHSGTAQSAD